MIIHLYKNSQQVPTFLLYHKKKRKEKTNLMVFVHGNQQIDTNQLISPTKIKLTHLFIVFKVTKNISMIFFNKSKLSNYPVKF